MPTGLKGVMLSVMLAALMSDLTSIFNSASTLFTMDVYTNIRKKASVRELMIVGRVFVVIMVGIGIVWIPVIQTMQGGQLYIYIQAISAYLAPPIASVYLIAILWKRGNEKGAFWGLMAGFMVGVTRMILDFVYREPGCGEHDTRPAILANFHYMYFAMMLFWLTGIVMIIVSLISEAPSHEQLIRVTFWTKYDRTLRQDEKDQIRDSDFIRALPDKLVLNEIGDGPIVSSQPVVSYKADSPLMGDEITIVKDPELEGNSHLIQENGTLKVVQKIHKPVWKRAFEWFCGFDDSEQGVLNAQKQQERIEKITSLKQDKTARIFLFVNVLILFALAIFLYIFFSTGSSFGLFHV